MIGLSRFEHYLKQTQKLGLDIDASKETSLLRQALTGENFATKSKPTLPSDHDRMLDISKSVNNAFMRLDNAFDKKFRFTIPPDLQETS